MPGPRTGEPSPVSTRQPVGGPLTPSRPQEPAQRSQANEYAELRKLIMQRGLLDKQPAYYIFKIPLTLGFLALSLSLLVIVDTLWIQLLNAAFLAFAFTQIGFIGHDAGHLQIFQSTRRNDIILHFVCFFIALDRSWWIDKHNRRHHGNPNNLDVDLDINLPLLAFTDEQALSKKGLYRFVVRYQAFFFFPMMLLEAISLRLDGAQYLIRGRDVKYPVTEPLLMTAHFVVYLGLLFYLLDPWHAVLFIVVHQALFGLFTGSVFAPNHKGMLMLNKDSRLDFLRQQVLTARNVKAHPLTDFWYGGLNYQIEHHLFPSMPRNKLREAQKVVKPFCYTHSISYHETGVLQSQWEILRYLQEASSPLRQKGA